MAQQAALRVWCERRRSQRVAIPDLSHQLRHETDGPRLLQGFRFETLTEGWETATAESLRAIPGHRELGAVQLELPLREAGCLLPTWEELTAFSEAAREARGAVPRRRRPALGVATVPRPLLPRDHRALRQRLRLLLQGAPGDGRRRRRVRRGRRRGAAGLAAADGRDAVRDDAVRPVRAGRAARRAAADRRLGGLGQVARRGAGRAWAAGAAGPAAHQHLPRLRRRRPRRDHRAGRGVHGEGARPAVRPAGGRPAPRASP